MLSDSERYDLLPQKLQALKQEIGKRVIGQHDVIEKCLLLYLVTAIAYLLVCLVWQKHYWSIP